MAFPLSILLLVALSLARIHLGVDLTDESSIVGQTQRFLLGDRPFVDDSNFLQTAQLLTLPLFRLFQKVSGGLDGLVLFNRYLGFALTALLAWGAYRALGKERPAEERIVAALVFLVYCPFQIPGLTYYSLGLGFFFLARCLSIEKRAIASGICDALAVFALFPLAAAVAAARWLERDSRKASWVSFAAALLLLGWAAGLTPTVVAEQIRRLNNSRIPHQDFLSAGHFAKTAASLPLYLLKPGFLVVLALLAAGRKHLALLAAPALLWWTNRSSLGGMGAEGVVVHLMFLAPLLKDREEEFPWKLWSSALAAGLVLTMASQRHLVAAAIGFLPGAALALFYWARQTKASWVPAAAVLFAVLQMQFPVREASARVAVAGGPYHGLFVTPSEKTRLETYSSDFAKLPASPGKVLVLGGKPAAYLLARHRPAAANLWRTCYDTEGVACADYYLSRLEEIGWAVVHKESWLEERMPSLVEGVRKACTRWVDGPEYQFFHCPGPALVSVTAP